MAALVGCFAEVFFGSLLSVLLAVVAALVDCDAELLSIFWSRLSNLVGNFMVSLLTGEVA